MVKFANRVKVAITQNSGSWPSTGTVYLGSAAAGYQLIPTSLNGETIRYVLEHGTDWEIGSGTFSSSAQTLSRSLASSSTGSLLDIDSAANVFISPSAEDLQYVEVYSSTSDLPSASSNHGRIAHVHGDGAMYFAHGGSWIRLGNHSDITTYSAATTSADGLLSASDKTKLDGVDTSANNYALPTASSSALGGIKIGTGLSIDGSGVVTASGSGGSATVNYSPAFVGARWKFTSTQSGIGSSGSTLNNFTTRDYDTTANNDFTSTNSRLTIPAGVSRVVVKASAKTNSISDQSALKIQMNGGDIQSTNIDIDSTGGDYVFSTTPVIEVTQGDYFEAFLFSQNSRSVLVDDRFTWLEIQVIEGSILNSVPQTVQPYDANLKSFTDTFTLPTSDGSANQVLKTDGSGAISFADQSGGIALTDLSVTQNSASGTGALSYNNTSGVFSYTPPASSEFSLTGGSLEPITTTKTVATANQTVFTGTWKAENISVFLNGVKLQDSEVTATDTQITISAAAVGDVVEVVEYGAPFASPYASTFPTVTTGATSVTVDYTPDKVAVYKNGVKLRGGGVDFTATNGTSITGFSAFVANDVVEVVEHGSLASTPNNIVDLSDTPSSLGTAGQILQMNSGANALEFADAASGVTTYADTDSFPESGNSAGDLAYVTGNTTLYHYNGTDWYGVELSLFTASTGLWYGDRGVFFGGTTSPAVNTYQAVNTIQYVSIPTTSNATDFGDLTYTAGWGIGAVSNSIYGVSHVYNSSYSSYKGLDYVTIATTGNAQTFGDLTTAEDRGATASDGATGLFSSNAVMNQITIATTANATASAASLSVSRDDHAGCANSSRAVFAGAYSASNVIDYVTWASLGLGTDFGNLTTSRGMLAGLSDETYGVFGGGTTGSPNNTIDYISIDTAGNATDFGDLSVSRMRLAAGSNGSRGIFVGGNNGSVNNTIDYITISSPSNATDFGDLLSAKDKLSAASGSAS